MCYDLGGIIDIGDNPELINESLRPFEMKEAYNLCGEGSMLANYSDDYVMLDVFKYTGLTLKDWLNIPRFHQETIRKSIEKKKNIEIQINRDLADELESKKK